VLLVKQIVDRYQSDCCYLLSIHIQETIKHCNVYSPDLGGKHIFALLREQPYIQNRKSIPTYEINTLTYAFCFWQFVVQV